MRVLVSVSAGLLLAGLSVGGAKAQDAPYGNWHGLYFGGQVGYGWGDVDGTLEGEVEKVFERINHPDKDDLDGLAKSAALADGFLPGPFSTSNDGVLGGIHVGGNTQFGMFVFGIEADYDWSTISDGTSGDVQVRPRESVPVLTVYPTPTPTVDINTDMRDVASVRGRVGIASKQWLMYGTAGWGWSEASVAVNVHNPMAEEFDGVDFSDGPPTGGKFKQNKFLSGFVYGGGVEYMISRKISLRLEALHYDFNDFNYRFNAEDAGEEETNNIENADVKADFGLTQVRAGISFHLN